MWDKECKRVLFKCELWTNSFSFSPPCGSVNSINSYPRVLTNGTGHVSLMFTVCLLRGPSLSPTMCPPHPVYTLSHGLWVWHITSPSPNIAQSSPWTRLWKCVLPSHNPCFSWFFLYFSILSSLKLALSIPFHLLQMKPGLLLLLIYIMISFLDFYL